MGYRKFKLVNSLDQVYELTDQNFKQFLNNPNGLGYRKDLDGIRIGNRYKITKREYDLPSPSGELIFYNGTNEENYDAYKRFVRFAQFYPLKLYYYTPSYDKTEEEVNSIYLNCEVVSAEKSQVSYDSGMLRVPVTFKGLSFWLSGIQSELKINTDGIEPSTFAFPLSFPFSFGSDPLRNIVLPNNGSLVTPVTFTITGRCRDPYIRFFEEKIVDGQTELVEYAACRFYGTFDSVHVDSNDSDQKIELTYEGTPITNPAVKQDLSLANVDDEENEFYLTFLKIKPGTTKATISFTNDFAGTVDLNWRDEYISY